MPSTDAGAPRKIYLGDSVYAEWHEDRQMIHLTTSNGIRDTNSIWLEPAVWRALVSYIKIIEEGPL
jgi:hypothetical protein